MSDDMRSLLLRTLRVPSQPQPPAGDRDRLLTFRASRRYFHYRIAIWAVGQVIALIALIGSAAFFGIVASRAPSFQRFTGWGIIELFAWITFLVQLPISFMVVRLDFEMRWYLLADRSLRIREGMFVVREKTMSYANIQNISIRRNPLQRIFGLATVAVRAAGGGSGTPGQGPKMGGHTHEALFEGVDNADEIREILRERIRRHRDGGLGDPDDVGHAAGDGDAVPRAEGAAVSPAVTNAARNLLEEARALRAGFGAGPSARQG